ITLAHFQRFDTSLFVRRYKNQLGLDPALQHVFVTVVTAGEHERREDDHQRTDELCSHVALLGANSSSTWGFIILRTSSGSKRSNSPLQTIAIRPGAAMICGNSTRLSGISPRAAARRRSDRTAAMIRDSTSR